MIEAIEHDAHSPRRLWWRLVISEEPGGEPISVNLAEGRQRLIGECITLGATEGPLAIRPEDNLPSPHEALVDLAEALGLDSIDLMEIVHEVHGRDAAHVNNNGIPAQVSCLITRLGAGEVEALIREAAADHADGDVPPPASVPSGDADARVLWVVVATSDAVADELLDTLSQAADQRDAAVTRATASDFDEATDIHGLVFTMDTTMADYDSDVATLRQLLTDAGIPDAVFTHVCVVSPAISDEEATGR